jgi:hypothetical protein
MTKYINKKSLLTLLLLASSALMLFSSLIEYGFLKLDSSMGEAVAVFATAKLLNGIISVIQGSGIDFGVVLSLGEILDPINDLVELFSDVMLLAIISIGIQKILLQIVGFEAVIYSIVGVFFITIALLWIDSPKVVKTKELMIKLSLTLFALYIIIPSLGYTSSLIENQILAKHSDLDIQELNKELKSDEEKWQELDLPKKESAWYEFSIQESYEKYRDKISNLSEDTSRNIEKMMTLFLFKTIIFPLIFLLFVYVFYKKLTEYL